MTTNEHEEKKFWHPIEALFHIGRDMAAGMTRDEVPSLAEAVDYYECEGESLDYLAEKRPDVVAQHIARAVTFFVERR